jgi:hypothetical protein
MTSPFLSHSSREYHIVTSYLIVDDEIVFEATGVWNNGSDLTTLWTTPHPRGMSTRIQKTANFTHEDLFSERIMVSVRFGSGLVGRSIIDRWSLWDVGLTIVESLGDGADEQV